MQQQNRILELKIKSSKDQQSNFEKEIKDTEEYKELMEKLTDAEQRALKFKKEMLRQQSTELAL